MPDGVTLAGALVVLVVVLMLRRVRKRQQQRHEQWRQIDVQITILKIWAKTLNGLRKHSGNERQQRVCYVSPAPAPFSQGDVDSLIANDPEIADAKLDSLISRIETEVARLHTEANSLI